MNNSISNLSGIKILVSIVFILLLFISLPFSYNHDSSDNPISHKFESRLDLVNSSGAFIQSSRLGGAVIGYGLAKSVQYLARLFEGKNKNYGNDKGADFTPTNGFIDLNQRNLFLSFMTTAIYRMIVLFPIFALVLIIFPSIWTQVLCLVFVFQVFSGYGVMQEFFAQHLFSIIRSDQFHFFWEFQRMQLPEYYDILAVGYFALLSIIMITGKADHIPTIILVTVFGQLSYEYFGFLTGVSLAIFTQFAGKESWFTRFKKSIKVLTLCGVVSVVIVILVMAVKYSFAGYIEFVAGGPKEAFSIQEFSHHIGPNLENYKHVIFRVSYFLSIPLMIGIVFGLVVGSVKLMQNTPMVEFNIPISFLAIFVAFLLTATIGFFTGVNYASEMGREFLPVAVTSLFLGYATMEWILSRLKIFMIKG